KVLYHKGFAWAVENNLLTDYKVIVLAVDEGLISAGVQNRLAESSEMKLDDATKIIGCYKALTKHNLIGSEAENPKPMHRALAFCKNIAVSKMITDEFAEVVDEYRLSEDDKDASPALGIETRHVDGTFNAKQREDCLDWLKAETDDETCRILTNARCLSEGVDVPALDSIIFMHPRKSQIDVVQSVGRVMRRAEGKDMGYVILPVAVPAGVAPEDALNDNERYQVVWQILNALRAHDERFDGMINQIGIGEDVSDKVQIVGITREMEATTAVVDDIDVNKTKAAKGSDVGGGSGDAGEGDMVIEGPAPEQIGFVFDELTQAIRAQIVKKCGTREYWDTWAKDIAKIAETHITRIQTIIAKDGAERDAFTAFLDEIRDDLNPEISESDAIEMLAQHLITKPVFDTLFKDNEFTKNNPVSRAMEIVLDRLHHHNIGKEAESLEKFYASVKRRAEGIKTAQGRQTLVVELYDKFFRTAFPAMTQKLGIVYTPVEVVDFIIHSVNDVLKSEFNQTLGSKGVHILDPFTGTGTFITRLLQSGLIAPDELEHKYKHEIHANEIVLLAYYIAAINIEAVYHDMAQESATKAGNDAPVPYAPFDGIVLTDTFQLYEQDKDMIADLLPDNSERRTAQKERDIRVIIGNPPYSAGQSSANDNAANVAYPNLDTKIRDTYAAHSTATNKNALYDSYIRAIRWATDRITETGNDRGVVAYVSNAGWVDGNATDGLRKCLVDEFSNLYVFHLRGNARTSGEQRRKEKGNVFGEGTRTPIAITVLVRNPDAATQGQIYFHDIGDYLNQQDKLGIVRGFKSIDGITAKDGWKAITPDENNDWLDQVDKSFEKFLPLGDKKDKLAKTVFVNYSNGAKTNSDAWLYNSSKKNLYDTMQRMVGVYNQESTKFNESDKVVPIAKFVTRDTHKIKWHSGTLPKAERGVLGIFSESFAKMSVYRPFHKQWLYFDSVFVQRVSQLPLIFPTNLTPNLSLSVDPGWQGNGQIALMSNQVPDLHFNGDTQCFPINLYEESSSDGGLFDTGETGLTRKDGISDAGLAHFKAAYPGEEISKEDLFYYIYGLLHSPEYRERFKNNLMKALPRIPPVKTAADFWAFSKAGRALGDLHVNYESVEPYMVTFSEGSHDLIPDAQSNAKAFYRVEKMKFGGKGKNKDKTTVIYNPRITMTNIPERAYGYVVNGKPALDWVMERQCVKTDKASGIVNDANDYANETVGDAKYPMELFQRVITVSLRTLDIVEGLPKLDID
ncbi:type ISP restriction/modification enzyme, partial [Halocynthiibacter sp.]|uniref:type ISP restriction/modification enzyme n=1 Tax=Halocynthiibacter sp. TaxID=1979210 RepID=UPI003C675A90